MNNREKQAAFRQRMQGKGLAQVTEWIPADERESYRKIAADMREGKGLPPTQAKGSKKLQTMEELLSEEAERAGLAVEEHLLRKVAEDLHWLHLMLSRKLAGGSTSGASTSPDQQAALFDAWVKSLKSISGRLGVFDTDTSSGLKVDVRPYQAAPIRLSMSLEYAGGEVTSNEVAGKSTGLDFMDYVKLKVDQEREKESIKSQNAGSADIVIGNRLFPNEKVIKVTVAREEKREMPVFAVTGVKEEKSEIDDCDDLERIMSMPIDPARKMQMMNKVVKRETKLMFEKKRIDKLASNPFLRHAEYYDLGTPEPGQEGLTEAREEGED